LRYKFTAVGNPVYDLIITPYVSTKTRVLSGCSTNACLVAKKLGLKDVSLIGFIGEDFKENFVRDLDKYGIKVPKIMVCRKTGGFKLIYKPNWDRTLEVLGISDKLSIENMPKENLDVLFDSDYILIGPILQEVDLNFILEIREHCKGEIFLDPQGLIRIVENGIIKRVCDREVIRKIIKLVDVVKPNEYEAKVITGAKNPEESAKIMVEWGAKIGIVTLGEAGSIIFDGNEIMKIPAYKTLARDPTGAGDSYAGAFIYKYLETRNVFESGVFASAAASIMVEHTGPDFPMNLSEVEKRKEIILESYA